MNFGAASSATEIEFRAVVTRADGTVEDLGRIAYYHKNPILRWLRKPRGSRIFFGK